MKVFHHALPIYGIQNAEIQIMFFVTSSLRYTMIYRVFYGDMPKYRVANAGKPQLTIENYSMLSQTRKALYSEQKFTRNGVKFTQKLLKTYTKWNKIYSFIITQYN